MMPKLTLLIHGPFAGHALEEIFASFLAWPMHTEVGVVLVVYADDERNTKEFLDARPDLPEYRLVTVKDLINPGFFNINRQLATVHAGLETVESSRFVIKLRNDQWVDFPALQKELEKRDWLANERDKLITTNCFTRKDRLYHPSDMFLCAWQPALEQYYSAPLMNETHMVVENSIIEKVSNGVPREKAFVCPEIYLCQHYLDLMGWERKYSEEDSFNAIKRYFRVLNSWEIGLRWKKDRTPYKGEGAIILPQYWRWPPFPGMEDEDIACYLRSDFEGEYTREDRKYFKESVAVWRRFERNMRAQGGKKPIDRKKQFLKHSWGILKKFLYVTALFLPHGIVLLIRRAWNTRICEHARDMIKHLIKYILRKKYDEA